MTFETEKGKFIVCTDKLHHPEWYGMVQVEFADEKISHGHDESVSDHAWTNDERLIAALAELTSERKRSLDGESPTREEARRTMEELMIPNAPGGKGMLTQVHILGNTKWLDARGRVLSLREAELERHMFDYGMTRKEAEARVKGIVGR